MKQYYGAADMERFIGALTRYLEQYKAEGDTEADRNIEIAPSNDLMDFAKTLDEVTDALNTGFGGLEEKMNRPLGRGPPAATPQGPPEDQRPRETHGGGRWVRRGHPRDRRW